MSIDDVILIAATARADELEAKIRAGELTYQAAIAGLCTQGGARL